MTVLSNVICCLLFLQYSEGDVEGGLRAIVLTSNGRAGFFCVECLRKPQVQCLVRRLHSQAVHQVFLPVPIPSFPFQVSTPILACNVPSSTSVPSKKEDLWRVNSPEWASERCFDGHVDRFVTFLVNDTIVVRIIVEAGWSRVPQHPPLHDARNLDVIMRRLQHFAFLALEWSFVVSIRDPDKKSPMPR